MNANAIPASLQAWAASEAGPDAKLKALMQIYAEAMDCQRCILYCRQPESGRVKTTHAWWSDDRYAVTWDSWFSSRVGRRGAAERGGPALRRGLESPGADLHR